MNTRNQLSTPPRHWTLLPCDFIHASLLAVAVPALIFSLFWEYNEYKQFTNPANWTMTTANVKNVWLSSLRRSGRVCTQSDCKKCDAALNMEIQVNGGPVFKDRLLLTTPIAKAYKQEIEETHKVSVYRSNSTTPEYTLSYLDTARSRYMNLFLIGSCAGLAIIGLIVNSWAFFRERITLASLMKSKFTQTKAYAQGRAS